MPVLFLVGLGGASDTAFLSFPDDSSVGLMPTVFKKERVGLS